MMPDTKPNQNADDALDPALERHLSDPAEKTEEVSGEQERARRSAENPTESEASTEQQPT